MRTRPIKLRTKSTSQRSIVVYGGVQNRFRSSKSVVSPKMLTVSVLQHRSHVREGQFKNLRSSSANAGVSEDSKFPWFRSWPVYAPMSVSASDQMQTFIGS